MRNKEVQQMMMRSMDADKEDDQFLLPGFRFHPTDEELVSFYLRKKIEKKLTAIELIKQIDIYKYDPWDLGKNSRTVTDKEWYFFCRRGRKYRNSVRPNRVTGSGFWKATGIDKPIYSVAEGHSRGDCIGLKKSLVYYCGSAGKGTKTDWMMHEFRLPADQKNATLPTAKAADQEAEVWTLCRIFKRNVPHRRYTPDWREVPAKRNPTNSKPETRDMSPENWEGYVSSGAPVSLHKGKKPVGSHIYEGKPLPSGQVSSNIVQGSQPELCSSSILSNDAREFFAHGNWDEIVSFMELSFDPSSINNFKIMH